MDTLHSKMEAEEISPKEKTLNCEILIEARKEEETLRIKSRQLWLKGGDRNTKYFHNQTKTRLSFNFINELKNSNDQIITGQDNIKKLAFQHFNQLYSDIGEADPHSQADLLSEIQPSITEEENNEMEKTIL